MKWEYQALKLDDPYYPEDELDAAGAEGWEVVAAGFGGSALLCALLKRPCAEEPEETENTDD
jgi:hypothetical protein